MNVTHKNEKKILIFSSTIKSYKLAINCSLFHRCSITHDNFCSKKRKQKLFGMKLSFEKDYSFLK